jgi:hypothetical protein
MICFLIDTSSIVILQITKPCVSLIFFLIASNASNMNPGYLPTTENHFLIIARFGNTFLNVFLA